MTSLLTFDNHSSNLDLDSPRSKLACLKQGIQPNELLTLTYEQIKYRYKEKVHSDDIEDT